MSDFANAAGVISAANRAAQHLIPPPDLLPSVWAEQNIVISVGNAIPGPISFANAPYQREMIDCIKEPGCHRVSLMLGAQLGKTSIIQAIIGYHIAHDPKSMICVQPTEGDLRVFLEVKLRPGFEGNKAVLSKMAKQRGRDGVNNSKMISFAGGFLMFGWAQSPRTLRGRSAPITLADEIDGYPHGSDNGEGDPVQLLAQRSATYADQRLMIESSTPTLKETSRIEAAFLQGDQRRYWVPCYDCGEHQILRWEQVVWSGKDEPEGEQLPETAQYACKHCGSLWDDGQRIASIRAGEWRAARPFRGHASFHAPELVSTFRRLRDIVQSYLDKIAVGDVQSFVNVSLAETYEEAGERVSEHVLMSRCEVYAAAVPAGVLYLTCGIDMQMDRLEYEIVGWGVNGESWSIEIGVLWGDPVQGDVWNDLDDVLEQVYDHENGHRISISSACLDTGGTAGCTQAAYDYLKGKTGRRLFGIKGVPGWTRPIVEKPQRKQSGKHARKVDLFLVGVDQAKLSVMRSLQIPAPGSAYCHFPEGRDADWFKQLTSEKLVTRYIKGHPVREWTKPDRARNEGLDCRVYALAALKIMNPNLQRQAERLKPLEPPPPTQPEKAKVEPPAPAKETAPVKSGRRTLSNNKRGGTWATKW